jgi:predicted DNA-binding transcriptional regulator AlpA
MQSQLDLDDALIAQFLGSRYLGRRYLRYAELEQLGLVDNRATLKLWMDAGAFPRRLKIPGPSGKTLVWLAVEIAQLVARRVRERDASENEEGAPATEPSSYSKRPVSAGRSNVEQGRWVYPTTP